jgi:Tfp pilus assembly protein PilW
MNRESSKGKITGESRIVIQRKTIAQKNRQVFHGGGFTVIELLVAMTLFLIVIGVVSGVFIQSLKNQRITASLISVNNNMGLVIEQMSREIRTGFDFCPMSGSVNCSNTILVFTNASNKNIVYSLENGSITRSENGGPSNIITSSDTEISNLIFIVSGESKGDNLQPLVTMAFSIQGKNPTLEKAGIITHIQTSISSRVPE